MGDRKQRLAFGVLAAAGLVAVLTGLGLWWVALEQSCGMVGQSLASFVLRSPLDDEAARALVQNDVALLAEAMGDRPSHVRPGRTEPFDEALARLLPVLAELHTAAAELSEAERSAVLGWLRGEAGRAAVPERWLGLLVSRTSVIDELLAAAEARSLGGAVDFGPLDDSPGDGSLATGGLKTAGDLLGSRLRLALDDGRGADALADCVGLLALARDLQRLPATAVRAVRFAGLAEELCPLAVDAAPLDALRAHAAAVEALAALLSTARLRMLALRLHGSRDLHPLLTDADREAMPAAIRGSIRTLPPRPWPAPAELPAPGPRTERVLDAQGRRFVADGHRYSDVLLPHADAPVEQRAAVEAERDRLLRSWRLGDRQRACHAAIELRRIDDLGAWPNPRSAARQAKAALQRRLAGEGAAP